MKNLNYEKIYLDFNVFVLLWRLILIRICGHVIQTLGACVFVRLYLQRSKCNQNHQMFGYETKFHPELQATTD